MDGFSGGKDNSAMKNGQDLPKLSEEEMAQLLLELGPQFQAAQEFNALPNPEEAEKNLLERDFSQPPSLVRSCAITQEEPKDFIAKGESEYEICYNDASELWSNIGSNVVTNEAKVDEEDQLMNDPLNYHFHHGDFQFNVRFEHLTSGRTNKDWIFSDKLKKLFINMDKYVMTAFEIGSSFPTEGLSIRAVPIFPQAQFTHEPVKRCPNHSSPSHMSNIGEFSQYREHLIRVQSNLAIYQEDLNKQLSVLFPVINSGSSHFFIPIKFMCLGSDAGGINRRPMTVLFTLEHGEANVIGRQSVDVRVCSCPKRDCRTEESRLEQTPKPPKKGKNVEEMVLVPVAKGDYSDVNTVAEALMVQRNPEKKEDIKLLRGRLLSRVNSCFKPPSKKPKVDHLKKDNDK